MSFADETDPLLPGGKPSPEVMGSRPQSINTTGINEGTDNNNLVEVDESKSQSSTSRNLVRNCFIVFVVFFFATFLVQPTGWWDPQGPDQPGNPHWKPKTIEERAAKILSDTPLIDGHNDLAILIRFLYNNHIYQENFTKPFEKGGMYAHVDLPRLKKGKVGGAFWAAFTPCPKDGSNFSDENYAESVQFTLTQIDLLHRLQQAYPQHFSPPGDSTTALPNFKSGRFISPLAIEGLHQIGNSLTNLRLYHSLGVRYATLTHNCHNIYADAALLELPSGGIKVAPPLHNGVSPAGQTLIAEMNRLGLIVDLSHVSPATMKDVLTGKGNWPGSLAPPIFSHSSAYAVCPHPRNVPDDILHLVQKRNSVVMVNFSPDFISCEADPKNPHGLPKYIEANATLHQVVKHVIYIGEKIGYDHVGLGSDFDGIPAGPKGLEDVSKYPDLVAELLRSGVSDGDVGKVVGGNVLRVWGEVDRVAGELQRKGVKPAEDELPGLLPPDFLV